MSIQKILSIMFKVITLFIIGLTLLLEGYFEFLRGQLPVQMSSEFDGEEVVYLKVVKVEEGFNYDLVFYFAGALIIIVSLLLLKILVGNSNNR